MVGAKVIRNHGHSKHVASIGREAALRDDFRREFFDTVQDLAKVIDQDDPCDQVVWKAEYLTRGTRWYHYYGLIRGGCSSSVGHEYNVDTKHASRTDPVSFIPTLMEFDTNAAIKAYLGTQTAATDILDEINAHGGDLPEVIRIGVESRSHTSDGRRVMSVTDVAFVGFADQMHYEIPSLIFSGHASPKWCRDRRFISALFVQAETFDHTPPR